MEKDENVSTYYCSTKVYNEETDQHFGSDVKCVNWNE